MAMISFCRLFIGLLLVAKVSSLSTNFMQYESPFNEEGFDKKGQRATANAIPAPSRAFRSQFLTLGSLRRSMGWYDTTPNATTVHHTHTDKVMWDKGDVPHIGTFKTVSFSIALSNLSGKNGMSITRTIVVGIAVIISLVGLLGLCMLMEEEEPPEKQIPAKAREELDIMDTTDGTWAVNYKDASGQAKQGLELLFRCHIIPPEEFAHSRIKQEHIDECIWIASRMLQQKSLEQWCEVWPEARNAFEVSVTECFEARVDVRSSYFESRLPGSGNRQDSPRGLQFLDPQGDHAPYTIQPDSQQPVMGRYESWLPGAPPSLQQSIGGSKDMENSVASQGTPAVQSKVPPVKVPSEWGLLARCKQIMQKSDAGRKSVKSSGGKSSASPNSSVASPSLPVTQQRSNASGSSPGKGEKQVDFA